MRVITADEVTSALSKAVNEMGEWYVYTDHRGNRAGDGADCRNWRFTNLADETGPRIFMCIAGKAYQHLGIEKELVGEDGKGNVYTTALYVASQLKREGKVSFTGVAVAMLATAQRIQDNGGNWGTAFAAAEALKSTYETVTNHGSEMFSA